MELNCPKCGREFRNTTLLTRHVNDCLDRDYQSPFQLLSNSDTVGVIDFCRIPDSEYKT